MEGLDRPSRARGQPLCLTPVLPVVLYTGQEPWDTNRQLPDLFDVPEAWKPWLLRRGRCPYGT